METVREIQPLVDSQAEVDMKIPINNALGVLDGIATGPNGMSSEIQVSTLDVEKVGRTLGSLITGSAVVKGEVNARFWQRSVESQRNDDTIGFTGRHLGIDIKASSGFEIQSPKKKSRTFHQTTAVNAEGNLMSVDYGIMDDAIEKAKLDGEELSASRRSVIAHLDAARAHGGETADSGATGRIDEDRWVRTKDRESGDSKLESALSRTANINKNGQVTVSQEYTRKDGTVVNRKWEGDQAIKISNSMAKRAKTLAEKSGRMTDSEYQRRINIERARALSEKKKK